MDGDFFGGGGDGENGEVLDVFVKAWCGVKGRLQATRVGRTIR